ncbi:IS1182 family transposase [Cardiobacterium sp. AH-315-I02]|nr:IS1182 family transposase [Cardiobacterium sp. AH-315-I02]
MGTTFRPYNPKQDLLLPPSLKDWLEEGHLAYFIDEVVDELDLSVFYEPYKGDGRRKSPYEPSLMLKILLYGYATGVFSSRKIAKKLREDVAFRVLGSDNFPSHRTIRAFRQRHLSDFKSTFIQVVQIAYEAGLVSLGTIAVDGTKVKANASKHKAMSYGRMKKEEEKLKEEIDALCQQASRTDDKEDGLYGEDQRGDELPDELKRRVDRLTKIKEAKARLEAAQREADKAKGRHEDDDRKPPRGGNKYKRDFGVPDDKAQSNFTDPESSIMKTGNGFNQCFNGQLGVDRDNQIIVENKLTGSGADSKELLEVVSGAEHNLGKKAEVVLADAGYRSEDNIKGLSDKGIDAYINLGRKNKPPEEVDAKKYPATREMAEKLLTEDGRSHYAQRKWIVEAPNGWIKQILGFRQFSVRGLKKAAGEWDLVCLSLNLRRMNSLMVFE